MGGIRLLALDGAGVVGGSKLLLNFDSSNLMLDFGTNFAKVNEYYEEFLRPRPAHGLLDYVVMEVLPCAKNLYREDLVRTPDLCLEGPDVGRVDAILISHGHVDHFGDICFVDSRIPIISGKTTAATIKAVQESTKGDLSREWISWKRREPKVRRGCTLLASSREEAMQRDVLIADGNWSSDFEKFWRLQPSLEVSEKGKTSNNTTFGKLSKYSGSPRIRAIHVDHSVKGATAYVIETSQGNVVYTGDLRMHGLYAQKTKDFISAVRSPRPYILITEGTRAPDPSEEDFHARNFTEEEVLEKVRNLLASMNGKFVIADFGARNIERFQIFLKAAIENHRKMVITVKDAYLLHALHTTDSTVPLPGSDILVYDSPKDKEDAYEKWVLEGEYSESKIQANSLRNSLGDFLFAFSFFDLKHLVDLRPSGGHYISSTSEARTEDQEADLVRMGAWLRKFGLAVHGLQYNSKGKPLRIEDEHKEPLHASGHAPPSDLRRIIEGIDPEIVVPVHTNHPEWFARTFGGRQKVIEPKKGEWIEFA